MEDKQKLGIVGALGLGALGVWALTRKPEAAPPIVYTCPYCGAQFSTEAELLAHIQSAHPEEPPIIYTCPICGATFATQEALDAHIAAEHPEVPPPEEEIYVLSMVTSGNGSTSPSGNTYHKKGTVVNIEAIPGTGWQFDNWLGDVANPTSASTTVTMNTDKTVQANFSEIVVPPTPQFACPYCPQKYFTEAELVAHIATAHPGTFICPVCGAAFNTQELLDAHIAVHAVTPSGIKVERITITSPVEGGEYWRSELHLWVPPLTSKQIPMVSLGPDISSLRGKTLVDDYGVSRKIYQPQPVEARDISVGAGTFRFMLSAEAKWWEYVGSQRPHRTGPLPAGTYPMKCHAEVWVGEKVGENAYNLWGNKPIAQEDIVVGQLVVI